MMLGAGVEPARPNGWEILSYLHFDTTQDSPPKHKSNVLPCSTKLTLNALSLSYDLGHFLLTTPAGEANCRCDCDNLRPDTLGVTAPKNVPDFWGRPITFRGRCDQLEGIPKCL